MKAESRAAIELVDGKKLDIDDSLPLTDGLNKRSSSFAASSTCCWTSSRSTSSTTPTRVPPHSTRELAAAINRRDVGARFLIALREDGLAKLDRFRKRIPNLLGNTLRLQRLSVRRPTTPSRARCASTTSGWRPASRKSTIEPALVDDVLAQVRADQVSTGAAVGQGLVHSATASDEIETAYLQLVMERLWRERVTVNSHQEMRRETLDRLGGAKAIAHKHFDEHLDSLAKQGSRCRRHGR